MELDDADLSAIADIQRKLLDLPRQQRIRSVREIVEQCRELLHARCGFGTYVINGTLTYVSVELGPELETYVTENFAGVDEDGFILFADKELEAINRFRRTSGSGVYHEGALADHSMIVNTRYYRDGFEPAGMTHAVGMSARLPLGEAVFAFGFGSEDDPGFQSSRSVHLLELLHPPFVNAFERLYSMSAAAETYGAMLNRLPVAAALLDRSGALVVANDAGHSLAWGQEPNVVRLPGPILADMRSSEICLLPLDWANFDVAGSARRAGLTKRQSQIAELLSQGHSDKQIARQLEISPHTARRHSEAILDRLEINSRSAVLLSLMNPSL